MVKLFTLPVEIAPHDGCVFWSRRTTNIVARRCGQLDLVVVKTPQGLKKMCRIHRAEFHKTGRIRSKRTADKIYSTRVYRP